MEKSDSNPAGQLAMTNHLATPPPFLITYSRVHICNIDERIDYRRRENPTTGGNICRLQKNRDLTGRMELFMLSVKYIHSALFMISNSIWEAEN